MSVTYLEQAFETRTTDAPRFYSASGYGRKIPSSRMIRIAGEKVWRRVYVMQFSNAGTAYVIVRGQILVVRDSDF